MRKLKQVVSTGCFFLCLGGWVYSGQLNAEDQASQARDAVLNAAAAQAATPGATVAPEKPGPMLAQAGGDATPVAASAPAASAPAPKSGTDLGESVVKVGVDDKIERVNFSDIPITQALRFFAEQAHKNIIASQNVKGTVSVNLYNVTMDEALDAMLRPNGFVYVKSGNFFYVYTGQEYDDIKKRDRKTANQVVHLKYMNAQDAQVLLKPMLSAQGQIALTPAAASGVDTAAGGATGGMSLSTDDTLVINDYPENLADITNALLSLDVRPKQVLIEATVLNASLQDANGLGVDLMSLSGLDFSQIGQAISPISGSASTGSSGGSSSSSGSVTTPGQLAGTLIPNGNTQVSSGTNFANTVPSGGLSIGFLSNHISVFLRALETATDTTVVANPEILALNKQRGVVHVGKTLGYLTTSTNQTSTQQTVQFLDIGTTLVFRPYIADDGWIRMEIHPEDSSGAIDSRGVPQTDKTEVTSNIMIRDGRTIVIGGLFSESTTASKGQVPVLGNIPILGVPFRSTNDSTTRQETIVLVTPHVINDDTSLYEESLKEQEDVQRMMLGNRAGLQPWGRDRIAHMWYAKAQESAASGDTKKAIMFLDWALNANPRLLEAIRMREDLTKQKMDEKTGSSISELLKDVMKGEPTGAIPDKGGAGVYPQAAATAPADKK